MSHPWGQNIRTPDGKWPTNAQTRSDNAEFEEFKRPPVWRDEMEAELAEKGATAPQSVLLEAHGLVSHTRQGAYGHPKDDFGRTAALANVLLAKKLAAPLDAADIALLLICVKLSREVNQHKRDNCVDGAGYFACLDMVRS